MRSLSLCSRCAVTVQSPCSHHTVTLSHCAVAVQSPCSHCAVTRSPCAVMHSLAVTVVTVQSLCSYGDSLNSDHLVSVKSPHCHRIVNSRCGLCRSNTPLHSALAFRRANFCGLDIRQYAKAGIGTHGQMSGCRSRVEASLNVATMRPPSELAAPERSLLIAYPAPRQGLSVEDMHQIVCYVAPE